MGAVTDGAWPLDQGVWRHIDLCLDCRACESACPSGVQYGKLLEPFRIGMQQLPSASGSLPWWLRLALFQAFPYPWRVRLALLPARLLQALRIDRWLERLLPGRLRQMQTMLP